MAKTVNVRCSVTNGLQVALHQVHKGFMGQETRVPIGDIVTLKQGDNPGIDKKFFEAWLEENSELSVVKSGMVTAEDEKDEDDSAPQEGAAEHGDKSGDDDGSR